MSHELAAALPAVYGQRGADLEPQVARYQHDLQQFHRCYGPGPVSLFRAPGRVNLIGEHTDYNQGYVLPMALDRDVLILARRRADARVRLANSEPGFPEREFTLQPTIPAQPVGDWANYVQGPGQLLVQQFGSVLLGCDCLVDSALPLGIPRGAGISSSSALTVAAAVTLVELNDLPLQGARLAEACGRAEWYVGTRGGIMDQFASVLSLQGHALFLDCRPLADGSYHYDQVPLPPGYDVVVIDSRVRHQNTGPHFNRRVAEGRIGVRLLQATYPHITHLRDLEQVPWSDLEPLLPEVMRTAELLARGIDPDRVLDDGLSPQTDTFYVRRRCRHVLCENQRVLKSVQALRAGDMATLGQLLRQAHASARDDYEISVPEIETLIDLANSQPGVVGARLTGAGWGGCIVALVAHDQAPALAETVTLRYQQATGNDGRAFTCRSAQGAGLVLTTELL
jgi:galactokinase